MVKKKNLKKYSWWQNFKRLLKMKLIVPMLRLNLPPEVKAMGVAVGLFWAMTPLVGIQMWIVFMTWVFFRKIAVCHCCNCICKTTYHSPENTNGHLVIQRKLRNCDKYPDENKKCTNDTF